VKGEAESKVGRLARRYVPLCGVRSTRTVLIKVRIEDLSYALLEAWAYPYANWTTSFFVHEHDTVQASGQSVDHLGCR